MENFIISDNQNLTFCDIHLNIHYLKTLTELLSSTMDCCSKLVRDPIELDLENIKGDEAFEISVLFLKLTLLPKINEKFENQCSFMKIQKIL